MENKHFILDKNFDPNSIKSLSKEELKVLSADVRSHIIEKCSINGGHLSSNLGVVELTIALYKYFDLPKDKIIFDVGHQSYAYKILSGRPLDNLRKEDGVSGFQKRSESIYDCYEAGHSSTSISAAMGMALDRDLNHEDYNVVALIGDSSIANGMAFEAINNITDFKHKIIIILNDNEMSIGRSMGAVNNFLQRIRFSTSYIKAKQKYRGLSKYKITRPFYRLTSKIKNSVKSLFVRNNFFESLGISYISKVDGHDFESLRKAMTLAKRAEDSVVIHVTTTKGKGYDYSEKDHEGVWHGVAPFDIETGVAKTPTPEGQSSWSKIYANLMDKLMEEHKDTVLIAPATTFGSALTGVMKKYNDRAFDVGISEEHAITLASGVAVGNFHPYVSIYSTFMQRAYDQIQHDVARLDLPVTLLIDRAGLVGDDGETHQGIFDTLLLSGMPNVAVAMAKDAKQAAQLMEFSYGYKQPFAIRYPRANTSIEETEGLPAIQLGQWEVEQSNKHKKKVIVTYGPHIEELKAAIKDITIINAIFQKPINSDLLDELVKFDNVIIYDIYGIKEGFAFNLQNSLLERNYRGKITLIALPNEFIRCGTIKQQMERYGVDLPTAIRKIQELR